MERKLEKRAEWADKARDRSDAAFATAAKRAEAIPFGQPILVGHHSEKRDRNYRARIRAGMDKGVAESKKAKHHESKARGLESALARSIFDDDPDAIERLQEKIANLEAGCVTMKKANAAWKKNQSAGLVEVLGEEMGGKIAARMLAARLSKPFPAYSFSNDRAEARRCKLRIEAIQKRQARAVQAEAAGGVAITRHESINWAVVTFAEKPERGVLVALREAGFRWGKGSWQGYLNKLPAAVLGLVEDAALEAGHAAAAESNPEAYAGALAADQELARAEGGAEESQAAE